MSEVKKTAKFTAIYALGVIMNRAVSFIMIPIYTRCLTPADYGVVELITMTIDVIAIFVGVGISSAIFRFYFMHDDGKERYSVISTSAIMLIVLYMSASCLGYLNSDHLARLVIGEGETYTLYFQIMFMCFALQAFIEVPFLFLRAQQRPYFFVMVSSLKLVLQLSLNIYLVVILQMHVLGVLYSTLISSIVIGVFLIAYTFKTTGFRFSSKIAYSMVLFGAPLIISNLCDFILTFSDRYFLNAYTSLEEVGIYSLGYKLGFVLWMFAAQPIFNVWGPQRFEIAHSPDVEAINSKVFLFTNIVIIGCGLGISLFAYDFFRIMSAPNFWAAYHIVPIIMIAYIIQSWTAFGNFGVHYRGKTNFIALGSFLGALSIICFSFLLIPRFRAYGAAWATVLGFTVRFVIIYYYSQRLFPLDLPWGKCLGMLGSAIAIYLISNLLPHHNLLLSLIMETFCFAAFFLFIIILPILDREENALVIRMALHPLKVFNGTFIK